MRKKIVSKKMSIAFVFRLLILSLTVLAQPGVEGRNGESHKARAPVVKELKSYKILLHRVSKASIVYILSDLY